MTGKRKNKLKKSDIPIPDPDRRDSWGWWYLRHYVCVEHDISGDESGQDKLKEIIIQDYNAWMFFVSLLMTVDMSALLVFTAGERFVSHKYFKNDQCDENIYKELNIGRITESIGFPYQHYHHHWLPHLISTLQSRSNLFDVLLSYGYIICFSYASILSTLAAYSGIRGYNYYNGIPARLILHAIEADKEKKLIHPVKYAYECLFWTFLGGLLGILHCFDYFVGFIVMLMLLCCYYELKKIRRLYDDTVKEVHILKLYYKDEEGKDRRSGDNLAFYSGLLRLFLLLPVLLLLGLGLVHYLVDKNLFI